MFLFDALRDVRARNITRDDDAVYYGHRARQRHTLSSLMVLGLRGGIFSLHDE